MENFHRELRSYIADVYLMNVYRISRFLRPRTKNYKSFELLAFYNEYGAKNSTIVKDILWHGDYNFQIPSSVKYKGRCLKGWTVLHVALKHRDFETFQVLVRNGADFTIKNDSGDTVLHQAFRNLSTDLEVQLSNEKFIDAILTAHVNFAEVKNPRDQNGISHFHIACAMNHEKAVRMFLRNGVMIDETATVDSLIFPGFSSLHIATESCCVETVELLLDRGVDLTMKNARGLTALHLLIERNMAIVDWKNMGKRATWIKLKSELGTNERIIDLILKKFQMNVQADDVIDDTCLTSLHVASTLQDSSVVERLLKGSIDLEQCVGANSPLWPGYTALHFAAHFNPEIVELLLKNKANFLAKDAKGTTPLDLCMQRYEVKDLHRFMSLYPTLKDIRFTDGTTSLMDAILAMKDERTLSNFFQNVTDVNMSICRESPVWPGYTLLHLAVSLPERKEDISNFFTYSRSDQGDDLESSYNCSEDEEAIYLSRLKMCLNRGANVFVRDSHNSTVLHLAFRLNKPSAVNFLLESIRHNLVNSIDDDNLSHLHVACAAKNEDAVKILLTKEQWIDLNCAVTSNYIYSTSRNEILVKCNISAGSTPLHVAVSNQSTTIVELLTKAGADISALDGTSMTPIHQLLIQASKSEEKSETLRDIGNILLSIESLKECETNFGLSHLHVASYFNNFTAIWKLLESGSKIDAKISMDNCPLDDKDLESLKIFDGYTPLHLALKCTENENAISALICRGADFLAVPSLKIGYDLHKKQSDLIASTLMSYLVLQEKIRITFGLTRLHVACATANVVQVTELLNQGEDPNEQVNDNAPLWAGNTALHFLMTKHNDHLMDDVDSIVNLLLDHGADVTIKNSDNMTCVHKAFFQHINSVAFGPKLIPVKLLLRQRDFSINPASVEGWSHFHIAIVFEMTETIENFLKSGIDVNEPIDYLYDLHAGYYPIHIASYYDYSRITDLLLRHGASFNVRNTDGRTPLHDACDMTIFTTGQNPEPPDSPLDYLGPAGVSLNVVTPKGELPVEMYYRTKRLDSLERRNRYDGVNEFNEVTNEGYIAIAISLETDANAFVDIYHYCSVINAPNRNGPDKKGRSVIHNVVSISETNATTELHINVIEKFMDLNFDLDHKDADGRTALHYAVKFRNSTAIRALLALGSNINVIDNNGKSPFSYAWEFFKEELSLKIVENNDQQYFDAILCHFYRLEIARIHTNDSNREIEELLKKYINLSVNEIEKIELEVERLKEKKLHNLNMRLWDFLPETDMISSYPSYKPWKRTAIVDYFQNNMYLLKDEYPEFCGLLKLQCQKAVDRVPLVEPAKRSFNLLTDYALPDLCCNLILAHSNNEDLNSLIKAQFDCSLKKTSLSHFVNNIFFHIKYKYFASNFCSKSS